VRVLLTGAAGFIGSRVDAALRAAGHDVIGVDALLPAAHGAHPVRPAHCRQVDIRDGDALKPLLAGVDLVCHQAAMVGAGVDAADAPAYGGHNDFATTVLLAQMFAAGVRRLVLASSMVVYGQGNYDCPEHGPVDPLPRRRAELDAGIFEHRCPLCGAALAWRLVGEDAPLRPRSLYAASKAAQEHYALAWSEATGGSVLALRYHNVYGPGMPRDTPYSGVAAIFRSALEKGRPPDVFEDGGQMRDFVHVDDVAAANLAAARALTDRETDRETERDGFTAVNVCSGRPVSILQVATELCDARGGSVSPMVSGRYRSGDVRHIVADASRAVEVLGFRAAIHPRDGLREFAFAPLR
jgi:dTDP-L-rhamnose 4-epimerase